jgi:hypothetical protein
VLLLACAIAESGLDPNARRPKDPAQDVAFWPDCSAGLHQRAIRWSEEYRMLGFNGEYPGAEVVEDLLELYRDPHHSSRVAAATLRGNLAKSGGDLLGSLALYNAPALNGGWKSETHRLNYTRALVEARRILGE